MHRVGSEVLGLLGVFELLGIPLLTASVFVSTSSRSCFGQPSYFVESSSVSCMLFLFESRLCIIEAYFPISTHMYGMSHSWYPEIWPLVITLLTMANDIVLKHCCISLKYTELLFLYPHTWVSHSVLLSHKNRCS